MPFVWCLGSIVGPALGGLLAEPTRFYPGIFPPGGLLEEYPFLLPNMVSAIILVFGIANGILFLEETHEVLREKRDCGRELGEKLVEFFRWKKQEPKREGEVEESERLLSGNAANYDGTDNNGHSVTNKAAHKNLPSVRTAFTRPVIGLVFSYAILAYHTMAFDQLMPVFLSTPASDEKPHNLLRFTGGLGMTTQTIGVILSLQGFFSMSMQFFVFPPMARHFGVLSLYRFCMFTYAIGYIIVPYLDWLPEGTIQTTGVYFVLAVKIIYGVIAYPCSSILITNSAPSLLVLGAINGIASSFASLARTFSPTITGMIYSVGLDINCVGLAWWVNAGVCLIGAVQAISMKHDDFDREPEDLDDIMSIIDEEAAMGEVTDARIPIVNVDVLGIGTSVETFDEYGLVRSVVEGEITALSESVPPNGTMASLARVESRIAENNN
jgi:MFS family permease